MDSRQVRAIKLSAQGVDELRHRISVLENLVITLSDEVSTLKKERRSGNGRGRQRTK